MTEDAPRKPRLALMGEFSAGKSTLTNLLLGSSPLPEKVTATRLSPVWLSYGTGAPYRIDVDGTQEPIELANLEEVPVEETRVIRVEVDSEILKSCDLIDFPGISDPNMDADVWERVLEDVDMVLWCTHATQAWRQSEAAAWDLVSEEVQQKSLLVVTRFDKLTTERDRNRVLARLAHETRGLFAGLFPVQLLMALSAADDPARWARSGAEALFDQIATTLSGFESGDDMFKALKAKKEAESSAPAAVATEDSGAIAATSENTVTPRRIVPRRVAPASGGARPRLARRDGDDLANTG